ncbi:MAG: hypothetical protein U9R15_07145 [Chloroflexota bacterium]|nr:hypothetical protein [Chloroflexota bacterium]
MKQKILILVVAVIVLSTLACSLTGGGIGTGEEVDAIETQPPAESSDEQLPLPSEPVDLATGQIPEGYPEEEIPIYEPASSVILGGMKLDTDDILHYNLTIGSNDDVQTVTQNIRNKFENESTEFEDMGSLLIGVKGEWEYVITINSGEADGYETLVTYTLAKK